MLAPVVIGVALNRFTPRFVKFVLPVSPLVSVLAITLICASIIGGSADDFKRSGGELILAVFLLHCGGFFLGYVASRLLRCDELTSRTISVEVGMQNSGLGAALAKAAFHQPCRWPPCPARFQRRSIPSSAASSRASGGCGRCGAELVKTALIR